MPLTPSHAAAALLLRQFAPRLPLAALVIGSLSPDFEYPKNRGQSRLSCVLTAKGEGGK